MSGPTKAPETPITPPVANDEKLKEYYKVIEDAIQKVGVDPASAREANPGQWTLSLGSATVFIDVYTAQDWEYVCVASPIMKITPKTQISLYQKLLELNHNMYAASFSVNKDMVWLRILRECQGLDVDEAVSMLNRVGIYADQYDDMLKAEYGGESLT